MQAFELLCQPVPESAEEYDEYGSDAEHPGDWTLRQGKELKGSDCIPEAEDANAIQGWKATRNPWGSVHSIDSLIFALKRLLCSEEHL